MPTVTTIGLDIAKSAFQVHGVDAGGTDMPPLRARMSEIIEAIGFGDDENTAFWDRQTGQVMVIPDADSAAGDESLAADAPEDRPGGLLTLRALRSTLLPLGSPQ